MNKVLVKVFFPKIDKWYEVWIPLNQKIHSIITQLSKGAKELNDDAFQMMEFPILYNRLTGEYYELNDLVQNTNIVNGTELILM